MNQPTTLSFWERDSFFNDIDVVIIGSGIVGLSTALSLRERDATLRIAIIERGAMPAGASTRNAGFACFNSRLQATLSLVTYAIFARNQHLYASPSFAASPCFALSNAPIKSPVRNNV